jgi:hypothetical protein
MKLKYSYIILLVSIVIFSQCKKKKEEPAPTNTTNTVDTTSYTDVCTPKPGNTQYVPLAVKNKFIYSYSILSDTSKIIYDTVAFGKKYFVATFNPAVLPKSYQRYNSTGDLVGLDSIAQGIGTETVLIEANPTVTGNPFSSSSQGSFKVMDTNASLDKATTGGTCDYTGLLKIEVVSTNPVTTTNYYYKKGIGLVYIECLGTNCINVHLKSMRIY